MQCFVVCLKYGGQLSASSFLSVTGSGFNMTVLMVMVKPAERGEVVEKFKQLIAFECCLYCPATLTPGLVEMGQVSIFEHR